MVVRNILLGTTKFFLGIFLALVILALAGAATGRYFITRLSELPERPLFDNDAPAQPEQQSAPAASAPQPAAQDDSGDPGLYKVVVIYPQGLLVRDGPGFDYATLDGVDYDEELTVLEEKDVWYRIRTSRGNEGWVKGRNNTEKVE
ncbi:MAG: SH3 domain-containing protein [Cyanobacteria bacterium J06635_1]